MEKSVLYAFQVANEHFDPLIKMILRLFGGEAFSGFSKISESYLAKAMKTSVPQLVAQLNHLHDLKVIFYQPAKDKPQITFVQARQDSEHLPIDKKRLAERRKLLIGKMNAMIDYTLNTHRCRMQVIQIYFDEETYQSCGICDLCIEKRKTENEAAYVDMRDEVRHIISQQAMTIEQLEEKIAPDDHELFVDIVRELVDLGEIEYDKFWKLKINIPK
jgi:ATP-dependent DNA helicase RecQ